jgi:hypothetical protein
MSMITKSRLIIGLIITVAVVSALLLQGIGSTAQEKAAPKANQGMKLPPPPEPVMPDGTPFNPVDQLEAEKRAAEVPKFVSAVKEESAWERKLRLGDEAPGMKDLKHGYVYLDSPILQKEENDYEPVRFMHKKHAAVVGDCLKCHHYRPEDPSASETERCSACHQESFKPEVPGRVGLKAAYHRQCMGCHKEWDKGPVGCTDCHGKQVPDHSKLVQLPDDPTPMQVTTECLRCHDAQAEDMLTAAHWLWKGPSPFTVGDEKRVNSGKATNTVNNFCIALPSNWPRCTSCHAGYGWKDANFDFSDKTRMDCLVCHDGTLTYRKAPPGAGMPYPEVDLVKVAKSVGKPTRKNCGDCHFQGAAGTPSSTAT